MATREPRRLSKGAAFSWASSDRPSRNVFSKRDIQMLSAGLRQTLQAFLKFWSLILVWNFNTDRDFRYRSFNSYRMHRKCEEKIVVQSRDFESLLPWRALT